MKTIALLLTTALLASAAQEESYWRKRLKEAIADGDRRFEISENERRFQESQRTQRESIIQRERIHREEAAQRERIIKDIERIRIGDKSSFRRTRWGSKPL